jgi:hypothetical protein
MLLTSHDLLALLPIGTALVLASRLVLGIRSVGAFAPALVAMTILQLGAASTLSMLLVAGGTVLIASPVLERLALPKASRLAVLVAVVCASLVATGAIQDDAMAFPLVIMAMLIERTWDSARVDGPPTAVRLYVSTIAIAFVVAALLAELSPLLLDRHWLPTAAIGMAANLVVGSYRGLRLSEFRRFAPVRSSAATAGLSR